MVPTLDMCRPPFGSSRTRISFPTSTCQTPSNRIMGPEHRARAHTEQEVRGQGKHGRSLYQVTVSSAVAVA